MAVRAGKRATQLSFGVRHMMKSAKAAFLVVLFCSIAIPTFGLARLILYTFDETVEESEIVIVGEVTRIRKSLIGYKFARIQPLQYIKGTARDAEIIVEYDQPFYFAQEDMTEFAKGEKHVLFLRQYDKYYYLLGAQFGQYPIDDKGNVCFRGNRISLKQFMDEIERSRNTTTEKKNKAL